MTASLKNLLKKTPTVEDINAAIAEVRTDGPRGSVLLGCALIEDVLRGLILQRTISLKSAEYDQLFRGNGPLASFSAKIKLAYALHFIGPETRADLDKLRELRNAFAHTQLILNFETPEVVSLINGFNWLSTLSQDDLTTREQFVAVIRILMIHIIGQNDLHKELNLSSELSDLR